MSKRGLPAVADTARVTGGFGRMVPIMREYRRYVASLSPNGTIRVCRADQVRSGEQRIASFRAYEGSTRLFVRSRYISDWIYRHYDC